MQVEATAVDGQTATHDLEPDDVQTGALLTGFVGNSSARGVFVRVSRELTARVFPRNLADKFVDDVATAFRRGRLVAGRVLSVTSLAARSKRKKGESKK